MHKRGRQQKTRVERRSAVCGIASLLSICMGLALTGLPSVTAIEPTPQVTAALPAPPRKQPLLHHSRLPLHFEANQGQTDPRVKFLARGRGYTLFLTPAEAVLVLPQTSPAAANEVANRVSPVPATPSDEATTLPRLLSGTAPTVVRMQFIGGNPQAALTGQGDLAGKVHHLRGNNPHAWHTNVPLYTKVRYHHLYPGIDLVYYGKQGQVEYDVVVAPGADPTAMTLGFEGIETLAIDAQGDLVLHTKGELIHQRKPVMYQEIDGVRRAVAGGYVLKSEQQVGFQVAAYDANHPLVIDPVLSYSTFLGGSAADVSARGIAVDAAGNVYVTGVTDSANFPITLGAFQTTFGGVRDLFVTKLDATGTALVYSTYISGDGSRINATGITVDAAGNVYVTGVTDSVTFPTTPGAFQTTLGGDLDAFVAKLNATGTTLLYSTFLGGVNLDGTLGIAVDAAGNAYVTGSTRSADFPTTPGAFQTTFGGDNDAFVTKLNTAGTALLYSTYLGSSSGPMGSPPDAIPENGLAIAVDAAGNACVTGSTMFADFPTTPGAFQTILGGDSDAYVAKLNATGTTLLYATFLGGSNSDSGRGIAVDGFGNVYVTGLTNSADFPTTPGAVQTTIGSSEDDAFVAKLNATGTILLYATFLGGIDDDFGNSIAIDALGNAYVTGYTQSPNFPTVAPLQATYGGGNEDAFVTKLDGTGTTLHYATFLGGSSFDRGQAIAVDALGNAYVAGQTSSSDFPITPGAVQTTFGGIGVDNFGDGFIAKISPRGPVVFSDKAAFLAATGASSATGPLPNLGGIGGGPATVHSITFSPEPGSALWVGAMGSTNVPNGDWTRIIPGNDIALGSVERLNMDVDSPVPVYALGFDFAEPSVNAQCFAPCFNSTFTVTLKNGGVAVGEFTFNAPNDVLAFVGVWSDTPFTRVEIREVIPMDPNLAIDDEFFGEVFIGTRRPIIVNSTVDAADAVPGDGVCETAPGNGICTLRAAIQHANATPLLGLGAHHDIVLPAGTYRLTLAGADEDAAATGDLDIGNIYISGVGATATIIHGNMLDRVFDITGSSVQISGLTITGGRTLSGNGGGVRNQGTLTLEGTIIQANLTNDSGGGVYNSGTLTVSTSTIDANFAGGDGGGIANVSAVPLIERSTISGNTAGDVNGSGTGGGLFNSGLVGPPGSMVIVTSTISGNSAGDDGGGLYNTANATLTLTNVTVTDNEAISEAGGIDNFGTTAFQNTISAGNRAGAPSFADCRSLSGSLVSLGHNLVGAGTGCPSNGPGDLSPVASATTVLGPLQDNGGPTETHALCTAPGVPNASCTGASPALDAGDNTACPTTDQRGVVRPQGGACDIGAYEDIAITIDARMLSGNSFFLVGPSVNGTFTADPPPVLRLVPGSYILAQVSGTSIEFTVTTAGTVDYAVGLEGVLTGTGSATLGVQGFLITIDATLLAGNSFFIPGVGSFTADPPPALRLLPTTIPGTYALAQVSGASVEFKVTMTGQVTYDPALQGVLEGTGTATLVVKGFPITIDATLLAGNSFFIPGVASVTADPPPALRLLPTTIPGTYALAQVSGASVEFKVTMTGKVTYDPALQGVLEGTGTATLVVKGFPITIDATLLAGNSFFIPGVASVTADPPPALRLLPTTIPGTYALAQVSGASVEFKVTTAGKVTYDPALQGVLEGTGTATLVVKGFPITIDARLLSGNSFSVAGVASFTADPPPELRLLPTSPVGTYTLAQGSSGASVKFKVTTTGTVDYAAELEGYVSGRGTTTLVVGNRPVTLAIGDVNGDGKLDLAVPLSGDNAVAILLGDGTGSFGPPTPFPVGANPGDVALGDVNRDGITDLVVTNFVGDSVSILLGNALVPGTFLPATHVFPLVDAPTRPVLGDLNRDGVLDVVVGSAFSNTVAILLGNALMSGSFTVTTLSLGSAGGQRVALGDLDQDGILDLVVTNSINGTVSSLLGNGDGTFSSALGPFATGDDAESVTLGDLNRDGILDAVVVNRHLSPPTPPGTVAVLLGDGTGAFGPATSYAVGEGPLEVALGDVNGDGTLDVAVGNSGPFPAAPGGSDTISLLLGNGDGSLRPATTIITGDAPSGVAMGDLNEDGKLDLAVANFFSGAVSILLNTRTFSSAGNFSTSQKVAESGSFSSLQLGDFNRDGVLDIAAAGSRDRDNNGRVDTNTVAIMLGNGNGSVGNPIFFDLLGGNSPQGIAVGDLDRDGILDVVVTNTGADQLSVLRGNGLGVLQHFAGSPLRVGDEPRSVALGDFDRDGILDVVVANASADQLSVLRGNGLGGGQSFPGLPSTLPVGKRPVFVLVQDLNRDGKLDLAVANAGTISPEVITGSMAIFLGNGDGSFASPTVVAYTDLKNPVWIASGDLDRDGIPDLVVVDSDFLEAVGDKAVVLLGNGNGTFFRMPDLVVGPGPDASSAVIGDFNRDGALDVWVTVESATSRLFLGEGDGNFGPATPVLGGKVQGTALGDLNRDGRPDVVIAESDSLGLVNGVSILLNTPLSGFDTDGDGLNDDAEFTRGTDPLLGDTDGDGIDDGVEVDFRTDPRVADSDGDGVNDGTDNCPFTPNTDQADVDGDGLGNACDADADNDGVRDTADNCPLAYNPDQGDLDGDGLGNACDPDADGDGVVSVAFGGTDCNDAVFGTEGCRAAERPDQTKVPPDSDGDGKPDASDNCPSIANANQANADGDSAGDACDPFPNDPQNDIDGDGISGHVDNCPTVANPTQANLDGDGFGDACDPDADGDTVFSVAAGGTDCNDLDATINPNMPEIKDNDKDDDCNPLTQDRDFYIEFSVTDPAETGVSLDTWLPRDGRQATITATVQTPAGSGATASLPMWTLVSVTAHPGKYTNDLSTDTSADVSVTPPPTCTGLPCTAPAISVTAHDFGASITLRVQSTVTRADGTMLVLQEDVTLPRDTDHDTLPDAWGNLYGNLTPGADIDTSLANTIAGDGLSNWKEYRGFLWGPELVRVEPQNSGGLYQTTAWVPTGATGHFRGNPTKKDLFVTFTGFGGCPNNGCPFALGDAFNAAGIAVHVVSATTTPAPGEQHIDVLQVSNDLVNPFNLTDGHLNKRGVRDWTWDVKGASGIGTSTAYGTSTLYQISLDGLFEDRPYIDAAPVNNRLDRLDSVEDGNDNSLIDVLKGKSEDVNRNGALDGDKVHITIFTQQLSSFDINKDGKVELPVVADPAMVTGTSMFENTRAQVIKRTTTHEIGHAVGMQHTAIDTDLMFGPTPDWVHDGQFSDSAKGQMQIHNN